MLRHILHQSALLGTAVVLGLCSQVMADPLPGEQLKFFQSPLSAATGPNMGIYPVGAAFNPATDFAQPFPGQDILSTANLQSSGAYTGTMAADDFSDSNPLNIGHITWWGSYMNGYNPANGAVQEFQISLYTNVPGSPTSGSPSTPGQLIATQTVKVAAALSSSSGTFTEKLVSPDGGSPDGPLYEYNAELNWSAIPFPDATPPNVEWLSIVALNNAAAGTSGGGLAWGWHDRDWGIYDPYAAPPGADGAPGTLPYHFMDDAVQGIYGGPANAGGYAPLLYNSNYDGIDTSMDLAFALYTTAVPEPATLSLLGIGGLALMCRRRSRNA